MYLSVLCNWPYFVFGRTLYLAVLCIWPYGVFDRTVFGLTVYLAGLCILLYCIWPYHLYIVNDRLSPRGLICQNDFLGSIFKV